MNMIDTEVLILAVQKYPCLWDITNEDYHNRDVKDLGWEQVCVEVIKDWESKEEKEKKNICSETKKKWNNVRDCFRRDINKVKNTTTGSSAKTTKKYIYSDLLSFLTPNLQHRSHEGNYGNENNSTDIIEQETENEKDDAENEEHVDIVLNKKRKKKQPITDVPSEILSIIKHRKPDPIKEDDDDTKFLLSFRGDMKEMTKSQKLEFRIGMLQLLKTVTEPSKHHIRSSVSSCYSRSHDSSSLHGFTIQSPSTTYIPSGSPSPTYTILSNSHSDTYATTNIPSNSRVMIRAPGSTPTYNIPPSYNSQPTPENNLADFLRFNTDACNVASNNV